MAATHTVQETEDWFDKVTVSRNMKELTNHSKQFSKIAEEASSVQQRLSALYEDMGVILNRYYDIQKHIFQDTMTTIEIFVIKKNMVQQSKREITKSSSKQQ